MRTTIAADVIVHNSPDKWDALWLICTGLAIAAIMATLIWGANKANTFWTNRAEAKAIADAKVAVKTRTWAERWGGRAKDVAALEESVARGEQRVILTTARAKNPTRLADFRKSQSKREAS